MAHIEEPDVDIISPQAHLAISQVYGTLTMVDDSRASLWAKIWELLVMAILERALQLVSFDPESIPLDGNSYYDYFRV